MYHIASFNTYVYPPFSVITGSGTVSVATNSTRSVISRTTTGIETVTGYGYIELLVVGAGGGGGSGGGAIGGSPGAGGGGAGLAYSASCFVTGGLSRGLVCHSTKLGLRDLIHHAIVLHRLFRIHLFRS